MEEIKLSIIILSYNTAKLLSECLKSLKFEIRNLKFKIEVIVVDNNSSDESVKEIKNFKFDIETSLKIKNLKLKIIENENNFGFAKGNNIGLKEARGEYVLFLNSDTQVFPDSLKETVVFMEDNPDVGALTVKTLLVSGKMDPDCHRGFPTPWASITYFLGLEKLFPKCRICGQYHKFYLNLNENHEIDSGAGAFMMVPKKVIDEVGGWDENYFFYGEDLDFYFRIKNAGYKVMFFAKPLLKHYKGASSGLRKESKSIANNSKENRIRVAKASVEAMEIFYKKFYKDNYPGWLTYLVLTAIRIKGLFRVLKYQLQ